MPLGSTPPAAAPGCFQLRSPRSSRVREAAGHAGVCCSALGVEKGGGLRRRTLTPHSYPIPPRLSERAPTRIQAPHSMAGGDVRDEPYALAEQIKQVLVQGATSQLKSAWSGIVSAVSTPPAGTAPAVTASRSASVTPCRLFREEQDIQLLTEGGAHQVASCVTCASNVADPSTERRHAYQVQRAAPAVPSLALTRLWPAPRGAERCQSGSTRRECGCVCTVAECGL